MDSDDDETGSNVSVANWQTADHFIRHVTVRQLLEADQMHSTAPFKIEDKEFKKFILVANICYLDECETYRDIGLDDGTGRIKAREWDENEILERKSNRKSFQVSNFPYVHVVGELEQYRNRNTIKVMDIEAVTNAYEPYYHVLHAVHDTLVYERGPPPGSISGGIIRGSGDEINDQKSGYATNHILSLSRDSHHVLPKAAPAPLSIHMPDINHHEGLSGTGLSDIFRAEGTPTPHVSPHGSNTQVKQVIEHTAGPLLVSPRSFSTPIISSTSPEQPRRPSRKHDPYSSLTALERDIILCIKTASTQHAKESIYPSMGTSRHREAAWKGLQFSVIVAVISSQHPTLSPEELHGAFEHLLDESYVFSPVDEEHFDCI